MENFIHPSALTPESAIMDNIAHELEKLNKTMQKISDSLDDIAILVNKDVLFRKI